VHSSPSFEPLLSPPHHVHRSPGCQSCTYRTVLKLNHHAGYHPLSHSCPPCRHLPSTISQVCELLVCLQMASTAGGPISNRRQLAAFAAHSRESARCLQQLASQRCAQVAAPSLPKCMIHLIDIVSSLQCHLDGFLMRTLRRRVFFSWSSIAC
jgi:uncharacterized membrane protein YcfT